MYYVQRQKVTILKPKVDSGDTKEFLDLIDAYTYHCIMFVVTPKHKQHLIEAYYQAILRNSREGGDLFTLGELSAIKSLINKDLGLE